jgi:hypothetical protein
MLELTAFWHCWVVGSGAWDTVTVFDGRFEKLIEDTATEMGRAGLALAHAKAAVLRRAVM